MNFLPTKITNPSSISVTHPLNYANEPKCVHRLRVKQVLSPLITIFLSVR